MEGNRRRALKELYDCNETRCWWETQCFYHPCHCGPIERWQLPITSLTPLPLAAFLLLLCPHVSEKSPEVVGLVVKERVEEKEGSFYRDVRSLILRLPICIFSASCCFKSCLKGLSAFVKRELFELPGCIIMIVHPCFPLYKEDVKSVLDTGDSKVLAVISL